MRGGWPRPTRSPGVRAEAGTRLACVVIPGAKRTQRSSGVPLTPTGDIAGAAAAVGGGGNKCAHNDSEQRVPLAPFAWGSSIALVLTTIGENADAPRPWFTPPQNPRWSSLIHPGGASQGLATDSVEQRVPLAARGCLWGGS